MATSEAKHAPGPWTWNEHYGDRGGKFRSLEDANFDDVIDGEYGCSVGEADARLIATAPFLLDALELLLRAEGSSNQELARMYARGIVREARGEVESELETEGEPK